MIWYVIMALPVALAALAMAAIALSVAQNARRRGYEHRERLREEIKTQRIRLSDEVELGLAEREAHRAIIRATADSMIGRCKELEKHLGIEWVTESGYRTTKKGAGR